MKKREIYLAGGCFWGVEAYFKKVKGVLSTEVGYANGETPETSYYDIGSTGHSETVRIDYDEEVVSLAKILEYYFAIIDPISKNKQGNDVGTQYRTGIYYLEEQDRIVADRFLKNQQTFHKEKIRVELLPLTNYVVAEDYHQDYLEKNPRGYCHININRDPEEVIKEKRSHLLSHMRYQVTTLNATEPPFQNEYSEVFEPGIYVDVITGEPLFLSKDKFESSCGWPSFSNPVNDGTIEERADKSHGMRRVEVRSKTSDSHLGHVFTDGPSASGGLRYCINSASMRFIPLKEMAHAGYKEFVDVLK